MRRAQILIGGYLTACLFGAMVFAIPGALNGWNYFAVLPEFIYIVALVGLPGWVLLRLLLAALLWHPDGRPQLRGLGLVLFITAGTLNALWLPFFGGAMFGPADAGTLRLVFLLAGAGVAAGFGAWLGEQRLARLLRTTQGEAA